MKRKVLIITPFLMHGGVEHSLVTALSGVDYSCFDVSLYLYKDELSLLPYVPPEVSVIKGFDKTHYYRKPVSAVLLGISKVAEIIKIKRLKEKTDAKLSYYIHRKKVIYPKKKYFQNDYFDIVISYCLHIGTEMALEIDAKKHYLFLHNSHVDYHKDIFEKCINKYSAFFAVSNGVKEVYSAAYPSIQDKFFVIDNYVDALSVIDKSKEYKVIMDNSSNTTVLCTCGRLAREKGFDLAINAARILRDMGFEFTWYFVGDGYYRDELEKLIRKFKLEKHFEITGYKDNPYPYVDLCQIYVQPSYEESQGLAIYEALLLGKTVVSTDTVGGRCTLNNGNYGIITDISAEGIAEGIKRLIMDEELRHSYEGCITFENNLKEKQTYFGKWNKLLNGEY